MNILDAYRLSPWEEGALLLDNLIEEEDCLIACGGRVLLRLPLEMKADLAKCLGLRISILRTDVNYIMRPLDGQG